MGNAIATTMGYIPRYPPAAEMPYKTVKQMIPARLFANGHMRNWHNEPTKMAAAKIVDAPAARARGA